MDEASFAVEKIPTDIQLLLCQLVLDAKSDTTWADIVERINSHPIVTRLHRSDYAGNQIADSNVANFVSKVIIHTLKQEGTMKPRGRKKTKIMDNDDGIDNEKCTDICYYQIPEGTEDNSKNTGNGRHLLQKAISILHQRRIDEIHQQLSHHKKAFAKLLREAESIG